MRTELGADIISRTIPNHGTNTIFQPAIDVTTEIVKCTKEEVTHY
jgi:hypothetical protein